MKTSLLAPLIAWLILWPLPVSAGDLTKIARTIAKEPPYQSKAPRYCLLVFGPEAKTRAWLVLDGDYLYIDRNGNGDLTEDGERLKVEQINKEMNSKLLSEGHVFVDLVQPHKASWSSKDRDVPLLRDSARYTRFTLDYFVLNKSYVPKTDEEKEAKRNVEQNLEGFVDIYIAIRGKPVERGRARLATRPQDAPILHFDGPLAFQMDEPALRLTRGKPTDLRVRVALPGHGKGALTMLRDYHVVPKDAHPVAEFEFPNRVPGKAPVRTRVTLDQRC